jgi:hypothetical protein
LLVAVVQTVQMFVEQQVAELVESLETHEGHGSYIEVPPVVLVSVQLRTTLLSTRGISRRPSGDA